MGSIVVGGKEYAVFNVESQKPITVRRWDDGQLPKVPEFVAGDGYNKKRVKPIDLMVWHYTGGEREPIQMAAVLRKRKFGIEFAISRSGTVYQFCDPAEVDTADAGFVNNRSVGCEVVNYGYRSLRDLKNAFGVPKVGLDREMYDAVTHGRKVKTAKFYPCQIESVLALALAVSTAIPEIQKTVPAGVPGVLKEKEMVSFRGHIGHYHVTKRKRDPGPQLMDALGEFFSQRSRSLCTTTQSSS